MRLSAPVLGEVVARVARIRIKWLRLATSGLPEKSCISLGSPGPIGPGSPARYPPLLDRGYPHVVVLHLAMVEEVERVLSGLAAKGHLRRVRVWGNPGGIFYSFWQRDAPSS
jgi:hypothetical protein